MSAQVTACWLSPDILLASVPGPDPGALDVRVSGAAGVVTESHQLQAGTCTLLLVRFIPPLPAEDSLSLSMRSAAGKTQLDLSQPLPDLLSLCRQSLAALDSETRGRVLTFLTAALRSDHLGAHRMQLAASLRRAREALRERLPLFLPAADGPARLHADAIVAADAHTFLVTGILAEPAANLLSLTAVSPEGARAEILPGICRHSHRRAAAAFTASVELDRPSVLADGWRLELRTASGHDIEVSAPRVVDNLAEARRLLLEALSSDDAPVDTLMSGHLIPGLGRMQDRLRAGTAVEDTEQYGAPCASPEVSVVIALGQRAHLIEHQLAQFVHDPEVARADVLYIADGGLRRGGLSERARQLHELYRVPFRIATLSKYAGHAAAIDAGTALARAPLLMILPPEALPAGPHWLSRLAACCQAMPAPGAAVPRVLAADDTEHAPASRQAASCLMIDRALLREAGGLRGRYVQGDFELADVCLRLAGRGRHLAMCPEVVIHLLREPPAFGAQHVLENRHDEWLLARVRNGTPL